MADGRKTSYRGFNSPANVCLKLKKQITQSGSGSISLDEVQDIISSLQEGVWTKEDVVSFFTYSPQKIFQIRNNRLGLNASSDSSSEDDDEDRSRERLRRSNKQPPRAGQSGVEGESCPECENIVDKLDAVRQQIETYQHRIKKSEEILNEQKASVQELSVLTRPDRVVNQIEPAKSVEKRSKSTALFSAAPEPVGQQGFLPSERSVRQSTSAKPSAPYQEDADAEADFRQKEEIFRSINFSRKIVTKSQIERQIVLPPKLPPKPRITLCSSSSDSDDSYSDAIEPCIPASEMPAPAASNSRSSSVFGDAEPSRHPPVSAKLGAEDMAIAKLELRDVMRQERQQSLAGFFDRKDQLDEERSGRHDPFKIQTDLERMTRLSGEEINAYLAYFRQLQGGDIEHLSSGSVVAAVLDMHEVDKDKEMLKCILKSLQEQANGISS